MLPPLPPSELPPAVRRLLDAVRWRMLARLLLVPRACVVLALLATGFWLGLVLDWAFEPFSPIRATDRILTVLAIAAIYVAYRYLLRRIAVPIGDSTVATLLERRFPALAEHVQTAVDCFLLGRTRESVSSGFCCIKRSNRPPRPSQTCTPASCSIAARSHRQSAPRRSSYWSIGLFALISQDAFAFWLQRIALSEEQWPRHGACIWK